MSTGLAYEYLAVVTGAAAAVLILREWHLVRMNVRVSKTVTGVAGNRKRKVGVSGWLASLGQRFRRFYSEENVEQIRTLFQSSGFNPHRTLPIWIGVKVASAALAPLFAIAAGELLGRSFRDVTALGLVGAVIGIMGPRLALGVIRRRFIAAVQRGLPDALDLLVVCVEAGMGLEGALERVAQELARSNPAMARVLQSLVDDLRVLPNRRAAFENLGSTSEGLRRFGAMVSQSLQYGTPLGQVLRAVGDELRRDAIVRLEERAHKLGAKLIIPMVLFLLPAMFVILGGSSFLHLTRAFSNAVQ